MFWNFRQIKSFWELKLSYRHKTFFFPFWRATKSHGLLWSSQAFLMMLQQIIFMRAINSNLWLTIICSFQVASCHENSLGVYYHHWAKDGAIYPKIRWISEFPFELLYNEFLLLTSSKDFFLIIFNPFLIRFYGHKILTNFCTLVLSLSIARSLLSIISFWFLSPVFMLFAVCVKLKWEPCDAG